MVYTIDSVYQRYVICRELYRMPFRRHASNEDILNIITFIICIYYVTFIKCILTIHTHTHTFSALFAVMYSYLLI